MNCYEIKSWQEGHYKINCRVEPFLPIKDILDEEQIAQNERKMLYHLQMIGFYAVKETWPEWVCEGATKLNNVINTIYKNLDDEKEGTLKQKIRDYREILWIKGLSPFGLTTRFNHTLAVNPEELEKKIEQLGLQEDYEKVKHLLFSTVTQQKRAASGVEKKFTENWKLAKTHVQEAMKLTEDQPIINYLKSLEDAFDALIEGQPQEELKKAFLATHFPYLGFKKSGSKIIFSYDLFDMHYSVPPDGEPEGHICLKRACQKECAVGKEMLAFYQSKEAELHELKKEHTAKSTMDEVSDLISFGMYQTYHVKGASGPTSQVERIAMSNREHVEMYNDNIIKSLPPLKEIADISLTEDEFKGIFNIWLELHELGHGFIKNREKEVGEYRKITGYNVFEEARANLCGFKLLEFAIKDGKVNYTMEKLGDFITAFSLENLLHGLGESHVAADNYIFNILAEEKVILFDTEKITTDYTKLSTALDRLWEELDLRIMGKMDSELAKEVYQKAKDEKINKDIRDFVCGKLLCEGKDYANKLAFIHNVVDKDGKTYQFSTYTDYIDFVLNLLEEDRKLYAEEVVSLKST